ncbi:MAG: DNA polymerase III subunit beta [Candidatus Nomurabacteria bacterium]|nr:MAG: DNA polymerase III subunit beta [Candidatus Nomurabacteria bacterium]
MKCIVKSEDIQKAVSMVERVTGKNLTLPILSGIKIEVKKNKIILKATNLNIGVEYEIDGQIEKEGETVVHGVTLSGAISNLKAKENITLEKKDSILKISTKAQNSNIKVLEDDEFPILPKVEGQNIIISSKKLYEVIKSVSFSASLSDIKPEIASVYIYIENGHLISTATDSFRLAEKKTLLKKTDDIEGIIIPIKNCGELLRILEEINSDVELIISKNQISIKSEKIYFTTRIIDGVFPDYRQIIPKDSKTSATILKKDFIDALKTSTYFTDKFNNINIKILPTDKKFVVETKNPDVGDSVIEIDAVIKGDKLEASYNYKYILDSLSFIEDDSIIISFMDENKPMVIKGNSDKSFLYLVMPLNR